MSNKPKMVKRILAKGKRFNVLQADGTRKRVEGPCTVEVTEAQAEAFKTHWRVKEVEVDVPALDVEEVDTNETKAKAKATSEAS